ncbi:hypothetical protein CANARDRAFT_26508 [[Candida] arabinofermentans NRRL YB-2248]|uniref:RlpA-like protein double-psi beta-barrel domain-containing protein n=1 Tax=[Candida] arabinofermentans NRRL YB-2248 TaxID=983967 RepID=A0A1E4T5Q0_9ASCO|nr:hypothetical protein CANARDRAFT_26508 [[Candida] arabinofermentans NRRL YB-2248]
MRSSTLISSIPLFTALTLALPFWSKGSELTVTGSSIPATHSEKPIHYHKHLDHHFTRILSAYNEDDDDDEDEAEGYDDFFPCTDEESWTGVTDDVTATYDDISYATSTSEYTEATSETVPSSSSSTLAPESSTLTTSTTTSTSSTSSTSTTTSSTSSTKEVTSSSTTSSSAETTYTGRGTYYSVSNDNCGTSSTDSDYVVAIAHSLYETSVDSEDISSYCGKTITASYGGNSVEVRVIDSCESCSDNDLDFSSAAFEKLAALDVGELTITWYWN